MKIFHRQNDLDPFLSEQQAIREVKFTSRSFADYNAAIFPGQAYSEARHCAVSDFMRPFCTTPRVLLEGVLDYLSTQSNGEPVEWVDMGAGDAIAMRQYGIDPEHRQKVHMTAVDLFPANDAKIDDKFLKIFNRESPGWQNPIVMPERILHDATTVKLRKPAGLLSIIEMTQYLKNPVLALVNWYNQLADGGFLIIAADGAEMQWMRKYNEPRPVAEYLAPDIFQVLAQHDVPFAYAAETAGVKEKNSKISVEQAYRVVIRRLPKTRLQMTSELVSNWKNPNGYFASYYLPLAGATDPIQVLHI